MELPIVKMEQLPARRRSSGIQITTLSPLDPTGPDHVAEESVDGRQVQEGYCLTGTIERGWLGASGSDVTRQAYAQSSADFPARM